ncbi:hypothetical protein HUO13_22825 [Saccharopolyspora erythraea]|uniref:BPL-N domain-containing protein n=1 Tax=Saccharopolyspora erythraea TaxID=1836 RepID=UPI001BAB091C|nr:BPL-N domain-containing protein [Saccharopolyspora erythraea]QUH03286.1 hypothetical protein HUO13_22825 [Saccharopolyspora erythraea]
MRRPLALVYRGPAAKPVECSEAAAELLSSSPRRFDIRYVGPKERLELSPRTLASATLYIQPGGGGLKRGYRAMKSYKKAIREFVGDGGRYVGFCLGGYLAGASPGFALLPGDTDQYISTCGATVRSTDETVVEVLWRGRARYLYFQDGAMFLLSPDARGVDVLARYRSGEIAALAAPFGAGRVAVAGPHPEATSDWFEDAGLHIPGGSGFDLGHDLIEAVMA